MNPKLATPPELTGTSYRVRTYRVIDADSIWMAVMLGFDILTEQICRLTSLDGPEHTTTAGKLVHQVTLAWAQAHEPLFVVPTNRDKFAGRFDGIVWDKDEKLTLNQYLLEQGLARAYAGGKKPRWYVKELKAIEAKAKAILAG